jgi:UPF0755 protein
MRWIKPVLALLLILAAAVALRMWRDYERFAVQPLTVRSDEVVIEVALGTPFVRIVRQLRRDGLTTAPDHYWRLLAFQMGVADGLHAGEYTVEHGMTPAELLRRMARGEVVQHFFTIVEGWNFRELRAALARESGLEQTLTAVTDAELMRRIGAEGQHPEGRFLPETYAYTRGMSDVDVLQRAYAAMRSALAEAWAERPEDGTLETPEQALTMASIVEKETGRAEERARIAGVFIRRLRLGMKLQTDPTVIYGVGPAFDGNLTRKHLTTDTPYNTYTRFGLPPTPIALPGRAALEAVMKPEPGDTLYFVARGDGSHHFSATLSEHNAAVSRYQLRR